jgi:cytochrome c
MRVCSAACFRRLLTLFWLCSISYALAAHATQSGDPVHGEQVYQRCQACHALSYNRTGPLHCGVIGRRAGGVPSFEYSQAMRDLEITWTVDHLNAFLAAPMLYVPGTTMGYAGVEKETDRRDLIAFFATASNDPERCPATMKEGLQ